VSRWRRLRTKAVQHVIRVHRRAYLGSSAGLMHRSFVVALKRLVVLLDVGLSACRLLHPLRRFVHKVAVRHLGRRGLCIFYSIRCEFRLWLALLLHWHRPRRQVMMGRIWIWKVISESWLLKLESSHSISLEILSSLEVLVLSHM